MQRMANDTNTSEAGQNRLAPKPSVADQIALLRTDLSGIASTVSDLAKEQIGEAVGDMRAAASERANNVETAIRAKPMQSAAIAAGIGFALGLLITR